MTFGPNSFGPSSYGSMTLVRSLSVVTAYASIVFVGAIVLGLF